MGRTMARHEHNRNLNNHNLTTTHLIHPRHNACGMARSSRARVSKPQRGNGTVGERSRLAFLTLLDSFNLARASPDKIHKKTNGYTFKENRPTEMEQNLASVKAIEETIKVSRSTAAGVGVDRRAFSSLFFLGARVAESLTQNQSLLCTAFV